MTQVNNKIRKVSIKNKLGMHARPAVMIAKMVKDADKLWLIDGKYRFDASSVIELLAVNGKKGKELFLEVKSENDIELLDNLARFFDLGFGENSII